METPLKIRYTPQKKDYIRASRALAVKTPMFLVLAVVVVLGMAASAVVLIFGEIGNATTRGVAGITLLIGAFYLVYYFILIPVQLSKAYKTHDYLREEREFTFSTEQVRMKIGKDEVEFAWENFKKVIEDGDLFVMIYHAGERIYPLIPKRAFEDASDQALLLQLLAEKSIPVK